jgi:tripartite ATP-independent transporter DctM subunit
MEALGIGLLVLCILMIIGVPVAMAFGALSLILAVWFGVDSGMLIPTAFYKIKSIVLLAIPFFIMVGGLMGSSGLATKLIDFFDALVGRFRGGLGAVTVMSCALFGAIAGTCSAGVAAIGTVMIPKMVEHGYSRGHSTALVSCSSILGQLIPPSVPMILFALVTMQSVRGCWLATVGPGILTVIIFCIFNYFMVRKFPNLRIKPKTNFALQTKEVATATYRSLLALLLPVLILGGVYGGITTPTESACIGVVYVIPISFFLYKSLSIRELGNTFVSTATTTGVLVIMLFFVMITSRILTLEQIPQQLASWLVEISPNKYVILAMVNIFLLLIGMLMDDVSGTLLVAPILFPVMINIGVHPLHFAAITGVNLGLGNVTPPTAPILYLGGRIGKCSIDKYIKPSLILMYGGMFPVLLITTYWPELSLFLPRLFGFVD